MKPISPQDRILSELAERMGWIRESVEAGAEAGSGFIYEQAPLYIQELIRFQIVYTAFKMAIVLLVVVACIKMIRFVKPAYEKWGNNDPFCYFCPLILCVVVSAILTGAALVWASPGDGLKALIAPRVYVVEKITEIL